MPVSVSLQPRCIAATIGRVKDFHYRMSPSMRCERMITSIGKPPTIIERKMPKYSMMLPLLDEHIVTQKIATLLAIYIRFYDILGGGTLPTRAVIGLWFLQCQGGPPPRGILIKLLKAFFGARPQAKTRTCTTAPHNDIIDPKGKITYVEKFTRNYSS